MPTWTVWSNPDRSQVSLTHGEGPPTFANGTPDPEATTLLWRIEAATYEEAATIHGMRLGYGPYKPLGAAAQCPACSAMYYPEGSGVCSCGYQAG